MSIIRNHTFIGMALFALLAVSAEVSAQATDVDCSGCVDTSDIAGKSITNSKIGPDSVSTGKISNGAVTSDKIAGGAVTQAKIADDAVKGSHIKKKAITSSKIAPGAVNLNKVSPELKNAIGTFCPPGEAVVGMDTDGNFVCQAASVGIRPAPSVAVDGVDDSGIADFRCIEWDGDLCTHPQARVPASTCGTYADAGVWHDISYNNSPETRICKSFCKAVTGDASFTACAADADNVVSSPGGYVAAGYASSSLLCEAGVYHWRIDDGTFESPNTVNIRFSGYGANSSRLNIQCDW